MYNEIYSFCKVRNFGTIFENDPNEPTPRVKFILNLLDSNNIPYYLDKFNCVNKKNVTGYNVILKGTSSKMIVAHHDVNNHNIDNANDNSCSVINAIMIKKLLPHINVVLLDGEEFGGLGSQRLSDMILDNYFGYIEWVLNLELTGKGGKYFFIGNYPGRLTDLILSKFKCPVVTTPFNDSVIFRRNNIDSVVINPIPPLPLGTKSNVKWDDDTYLDFSLLYNCHSSRDTVETIDVNDMREFVEDVIIKILENDSK